MAALTVSVSPDVRPRLIAFMVELIEKQPDSRARAVLALPMLPAAKPGPERDMLVRIVLDALATDDPARTANNLASIAPYADGELARAALDRARALPQPSGLVSLRRKISDPAELAFFYCHAPARQPASLPALISAAEKRWPVVEECHQQGKGQVGLDQHQVRLWPSFCRHTVLSMLRARPARRRRRPATSRPATRPADHPRRRCSPGAVALARHRHPPR